MKKTTVSLLRIILIFAYSAEPSFPANITFQTEPMVAAGHDICH